MPVGDIVLSTYYQTAYPVYDSGGLTYTYFNGGHKSNAVERFSRDNGGIFLFIAK